MKRPCLITIAAAALFALTLSACGSNEAGSPDFAATDLAGLNFAPNELPRLEYQRDSSGAGAFFKDQEEEAREEGDESGLKLLGRLRELGLDRDHVSQFFATTRDAELSFVESITFLFQDERGAEEAVDLVGKASAENTRPAKEIDAPELGTQAFGLRGEFDGSLVYSFGWRVGDVIQIIGVAPGDQDAGPDSALQLAERLEAKAED
jgi:hypothetical protein